MRILSIILAALLALCGMQCCLAEQPAPAYTQITQDAARDMMLLDDGHVIVDVRRQDEYDAGHIPGAVLIPNEDIGDALPAALPDLGQIILVYCRSGNRSRQAAQKLAALGYTNVYEFGGIIDWTGEIVTTEAEAPSDAHGAITRLTLQRGGYSGYWNYELEALDGEYYLTAYGAEPRKVSASLADSLYGVAVQYDLFKWDGFKDSDPRVLDGESFRLYMEFADGASITAGGDNAFPPNYFDSIQALTDVLESSEAYGVNSFFSILAGLAAGKSELAVGADIAFDAITDFYYTYESSTFPPEYQRYRFYLEDGRRCFFHETREGDSFPLTEADATQRGTLELTADEWAEFCACIAGGTVKRREESIVDGDAGPWMYLYWTGDKGEYQEYSFASYGAQLEFEAMCEALRER